MVSATGASTEDENFQAAYELMRGLTVEQQTVLTRALTAYFHLCEPIRGELPRPDAARARARGLPRLRDRRVQRARHGLPPACGRGRRAACQRASRAPRVPPRVHRCTPPRPVARPSRARSAASRACSSNTRTWAAPTLAENERHMLQEIDALLRTSSIALKKPTPVEEADTIIDIFDNTLFDMVPQVYRRFDDWVLGDNAGKVQPFCPAFFHPGSWIGSDRDGNPNVTAKVSRARGCQVLHAHGGHARGQVPPRGPQPHARRRPHHALRRALSNLWNHQVEMSEKLDGPAPSSSSELRAAPRRHARHGRPPQGHYGAQLRHACTAAATSSSPTCASSSARSLPAVPPAPPTAPSRR